MSADHLPANFRLVRLELAREPGHPAGDPADRYRMVLPLQSDGRIDVDAYQAHADRCRVVHEGDDGERSGLVTRGPGGQWLLRYADGEQEVGFRLGEERFVPGEYIGIRRDDGEHTYRVVSQQPI